MIFHYLSFYEMKYEDKLKNALKQSRDRHNTPESSVGKKLVENAYRLENEEDFEGAIKVYSKLIDLYKDSIFYFQRAKMHGHLNQHEEALSDYDQAIRLETDDPDCYLNRGNIFLRQKNSSWR